MMSDEDFYKEFLSQIIIRFDENVAKAHVEKFKRHAQIVDSELDSFTNKMKHELGFTDLDINKIGPVLKLFKAIGLETESKIETIGETLREILAGMQAFLSQTRFERMLMNAERKLMMMKLSKLNKDLLKFALLNNFIKLSNFKKQHSI